MLSFGSLLHGCDPLEDVEEVWSAVEVDHDSQIKSAGSLFCVLEVVDGVGAGDASEGVVYDLLFFWSECGIYSWAVYQVAQPVVDLSQCRFLPGKREA